MTIKHSQSVFDHISVCAYKTVYSMLGGFMIKFFFIYCFFIASVNANFCQTSVESYLIERYHFQNTCDVYLDCIDPIELKEETQHFNVYEVFVFFGNSGGYPSEFTYKITTDKNCNVFDIARI